MNKQMVLALGAGATAFAAVVGSAATLGGINSDSLGADTSVVASCDSDTIGVEYATTYDGVEGRYEISGITLTGVDAACNGQTASVVLAADATSAAIEEVTSTVAVAAEDLVADPPVALDEEHPVTFAGVDAETVGFVAVVISG